jgi:hypothetical protein
MCYNESKLMAYLDCQLAPQEMAVMSEHIAVCPCCQKMLAGLQSEQQQVAGWLGAYRAAAMSDRGKPVEKEVTLEQGMFLPKKGVQKIMRRYQKLVVAVAAAALVVGLFSFAPMRSWAAQFLQVFRVNQVQVLHFKSSDVQQLQQAMQTYGKDAKIESFGDVRRDQVTDFARLDGQTIRVETEKIAVPEKIGTYQRVGEVKINPGEKFAIKPKVAGINGLLSSMGSQKLMPQAINGKTFTIEMPPMVKATYQGADGKQFTLCRTIAPQFTVPDGVDINQLREAVLGIPILPDNMRNTLAGVKSFGSTMLVPDFGFEQAGTMSEVMVSVSKGVYIQPQKMTGLRSEKQQSEVHPQLNNDKTIIWPAGNVWSALIGDFTQEQATALAGLL